MTPECARLLNTETEGGRSEQRNSLRRDMALAQDVRADSSISEVRENRDHRFCLDPVTDALQPWTVESTSNFSTGDKTIKYAMSNFQTYDNEGVKVQ